MPERWLHLLQTNFDEPWFFWVIVPVVAASSYLVLISVRRIIRRQYLRMQATEVREALELPFQAAASTAGVFLVVLSVFVGLQVTSLPPALDRLSVKLVTIALFWQAALWASTAAGSWLDQRRREQVARDAAATSSIGIIRFIARLLIWSVAVLLTLDNLGVDITALVAGLGIGGIAVALAVQNVLGDLLASLSIALDRPFVVGDFLIVEEYLGSVEYIGIKSTRLRSLSGEQIIMSNSDLLSSRVRNYGRMVERRVVFTLGVTYETPREVLRQIPGIVRSIVGEHQKARFDRCHFATYGPHSLDFETVYYVLGADYTQYMDVQQSINLRIHEEFEKLPAVFAYPTQTVWIAGRT